MLLQGIPFNRLIQFEGHGQLCTHSWPTLPQVICHRFTNSSCRTKGGLPWDSLLNSEHLY